MHNSDLLKHWDDTYKFIKEAKYVVCNICMHTYVYMYVYMYVYVTMYGCMCVCVYVCLHCIYSVFTLSVVDFMLLCTVKLVGHY